jgi:hypothetical protein
MRTQDQRAPTSSSISPTLRLDLSTSKSVSSSGKCDTVATNAERDPQQTPLAAAVSIRPSSSSATAGMGIAWADDPSVLPSTKPRTRAVENYRASNFASTSCRASSSTLWHPTAFSKWSASQARLGSGPSRRSETLDVGRSSFERHPPPCEARPPTLPLSSHGQRCWANARALTLQQSTPPLETRQAPGPSHYGGGLQVAFPRTGS